MDNQPRIDLTEITLDLHRSPTACSSMTRTQPPDIAVLVRRHEA
jgi:hypothetical protein